MFTFLEYVNIRIGLIITKLISGHLCFPYMTYFYRNLCLASMHVFPRIIVLF
jgi:hypothetical protein